MTIEIDSARRLAICDGQPVELTESEMKLLERLADDPGRVYRHRELLETLWGDRMGAHVDSNTVYVHMSNLRRKLGRDTIRTVSAFGYALRTAA